MKRTLKTLFALMAGMLAFSACGDDFPTFDETQTDATPNSNNAGGEEIRTFEAFTPWIYTRTSIDGRDIKWQSDDDILVIEAIFPFNPNLPDRPQGYGWDEKYAHFVLTSGAGSASAIFKWDEKGEGVGKIPDEKIDKADIYAFYPALTKRYLSQGEIDQINDRIWNALLGDGDADKAKPTPEEEAKIRAFENGEPYPVVQAELADVKKLKNIFLPNLQVVAGDQIMDPKAALMVAQARFDQWSWSWGKLPFESICSYIKVTPTVALEKIEVRANKDGEVLAAKIGVNTETFEVTAEEHQSSSVTLKATGKGKLAAKTYYISVLPGTLSQGMSIRFYTDDKNYNESVIDTSLTLMRHRVFDGGSQPTTGGSQSN